MNYKFILGGEGCEVFLHEIDQTKKDLLKESKIKDVQGNFDFEKLEEILEESWDYTEFTYEGVYIDSYYISVFDEDDNFIWESTPEFWDITDMEIITVDKKDVLLIEQNMKGDFREYSLDLDEPFDPNKIAFKLMEINDLQIITALKYDENDIVKSTWCSDKWTKDYFFRTF